MLWPSKNRRSNPGRGKRSSLLEIIQSVPAVRQACYIMGARTEIRRDASLTTHFLLVSTLILAGSCSSPLYCSSLKMTTVYWRTVCNANATCQVIFFYYFTTTNCVVWTWVLSTAMIFDTSENFIVFSVLLILVLGSKIVPPSYVFTCTISCRLSCRSSIKPNFRFPVWWFCPFVTFFSLK